MNLTFILFGFSNGYSVTRKLFLDFFLVLSFLLNKVLNYISCFRWSISPKSVFLSCLCRLVRCRHGFRLLNQINHVFAANGRLKEGTFCLKGTAEVRFNSSFPRGRFFFHVCIRGFWEFLYFLNVFFLNLIFLFFYPQQLLMQKYVFKLQQLIIDYPKGKASDFNIVIAV